MKTQLQSAGFGYEELFAFECELRSLDCQRMPSQGEYDFLVNGHRVQCKHVTFVESSDKRFGRIRLSRGSGCSSERNYASDAFDFFAVSFRKSTHIVPVAAVGEVNGRMRRRVRVDQLTEFRERWDLLSSSGQYVRPMPLFDCMN